MSVRRGQCLCGAVTFTAEKVDTEVGACHCRMCQRWSGGIFIAVTSSGVSFEGEEHIRTYRSSDWAERGSCSKCGTLLFYRLLDSGEYEMAIGVFDDQSDFVMAGEIFIDRKPDAYAMAGEHPRLTEAETLERYKELAK